VAQTKTKINPQLLKFFDPKFFTKKFGGVRGEALRKQNTKIKKSPNYKSF